MQDQSGFEEILSSIPTDDSVEEIPEEYTPDFIELSQLGYLSTTVEYCGHNFGLKTLTFEEEVAAAKLVKLAEDSMAQFKVSIGGIVAASLTSINGQPWMPNITAMETEYWVQQKYQKLGKFFTPLIEFLFQEQVKLNERRDQALQELEKKFSGGIKTSSDS